MNTGVRHAFGDVLYELNADGNVVVTDGNRQGVFLPDARWLSGDLKECDPHMVGWVAGGFADRVGSKGSELKSTLA